jgi:hypothetical protein
MGRLIPAGTGIDVYRRVNILTHEEAAMADDDFDTVEETAPETATGSAEAKLYSLNINYLG